MTWWRYVRLAFWIIVPVILLILPADFFDTGQALCLSVLLFKQECYACGMTRSIMHLIHFEFEDALYYNMLGLIVFPLLAYQWFLWFWHDWKLFRQKEISAGK
jgi:hypothetical protein